MGKSQALPQAHIPHPSSAWQWGSTEWNTCQTGINWLNVCGGGRGHGSPPSDGNASQTPATWCSWLSEVVDGWRACELGAADGRENREVRQHISWISTLSCCPLFYQGLPNWTAPASAINPEHQSQLRQGMSPTGTPHRVSHDAHPTVSQAP